MSNFQIGLAIAGGVVLVGVVAHGAWSSRRNKPRQAQEFVLQEPVMTSEPNGHPLQEASYRPASPLSPNSGQVVSTSQQLLDVLPVEPASTFVSSAFGSPAASAVGNTWSDDEKRDLPPIEKQAELDALIDILTPIEMDQRVAGESALAHVPTSNRVGSKFFAVEGLDVKSGKWEPVASGQRYSAFQAGLQLANRSGPLNEIEFSEYVVKVQSFADALPASAEFPDMLEVISRARELDQFASAHDAQLSFTLRASRAAWSPGYVQQNAARLGFVPGVIPGRMVLPAPAVGLAPILVLSFDSQAAMAEDPAQSAIREIQLSLDVPHVQRGEEPFARLCQAATELAKVMDGTITDDNGQTLQEAALRAIDTDLRSLYNSLDARDLSAGSVAARRLFS